MTTPDRKTEIISLRLTPSQQAKLASLAQERGCTVSDLIRQAALAQAEKPIGWRCKHVELTGPSGVLSAPSTYCGCYMAPIYEGDPGTRCGLPERTRRTIANLHRDEVLPNSGVAIAPWNRETTTP